ncbi:MAG: protein-export chaperone SecB [Hyphomicrobiaceae bacterium]
MAEQPKVGPTGNGGPGPGQMQVRVLGQYIKDLSFENPNITKLLSGPPDNPNLKLEVNVVPTQVGPDIHESAITFKAQATSKLGVIYELELVYAGLFKIENAPPEALEPILNINGPALLFPFLRRIVADISREGGFPPLLLDPVDFASLFIKKREALAQATAQAVKPNA